MAGRSCTCHDQKVVQGTRKSSWFRGRSKQRGLLPKRHSSQFLRSDLKRALSDHACGSWKARYGSATMRDNFTGGGGRGAGSLDAAFGRGLALSGPRLPDNGAFPMLPSPGKRRTSSRGTARMWEISCVRTGQAAETRAHPEIATFNAPRRRSPLPQRPPSNNRKVATQTQ